MRILSAAVFLLLIATSAWAGAVKRKEPGPKAKGKVYEWAATNGLVYYYYVPKKYDPAKGANLTFILHGSNGMRGWGFANCPAGKFRKDDIVVSPDGTTSNGRGGFNSLGRPEDAKRFRAVHKELKEIFKVNATYLYGHSQGSFFSLYYAGEYPDEVQGVVAFASGVWTQTRLEERGHKQAIVLLHGTQDPVVPYAQSVGALQAYRETKYPILHLKSIEGWNHWPTANNSKVPHTQQQLAWCEGMTTKDPERLAASFEFLANNKVKMRHDYAATYSLAKRVTEADFASDALKKRAAKAMTTIDALAKAHVAALKGADPSEFAAKPWVGHAPMFLRSFRGVPSCEVFATDWDPAIDKHREAAVPQLRLYYQNRGNNVAAAFAAGVAAIEAGFLHYECNDNRFLKALEDWAKQAKRWQIPRDVLKRYNAIVPAYKKALQEAYRSCDGVNRKAGKL
ncbi:MAG: alpha/beta fold hydrolase [Planctomycetota bacterium]|jgi:predicted esterase